MLRPSQWNKSKNWDMYYEESAKERKFALVFYAKDQDAWEPLNAGDAKPNKYPDTFEGRVEAYNRYKGNGYGTEPFAILETRTGILWAPEDTYKRIDRGRKVNKRLVLKLMEELS